MQERVPLRPTVSATVSDHTLLLNLQAIEHYLLRMRVAGIVPDLERKSCPFGKGAAGAMHKVLTQMGWRDMAQGAEFHSHAHDSACALLSHNGHDLVEQVKPVSSHCLRRGSTLALRGRGFNPALDQGDAHAPLEPQHKVPRPKGRGLKG